MKSHDNGKTSKVGPTPSRDREAQRVRELLSNDTGLSHWRCFMCRTANLTTSVVCRNCHKWRWQHLGVKLSEAIQMVSRIEGKSGRSN